MNMQDPEERERGPSSASPRKSKSPSSTTKENKSNNNKKLKKNSTSSEKKKRKQSPTGNAEKAINGAVKKASNAKSTPSSSHSKKFKGTKEGTKSESSKKLIAGSEVERSRKKAKKDSQEASGKLDSSVDNSFDSTDSASTADKDAYLAARAAITPKEASEDSSITSTEKDSPVIAESINSSSGSPKARSPNANGKGEGKKKSHSTPVLLKPINITKSSSYLDLAHDAIVKLKDRSGSSHPSILKFLYATYDEIMLSKVTTKKQTPAQVRQHVMNALKSGVKSGRFVRVKNSFKINSEWVKQQKAQASAARAKLLAEKRAKQKELERLKRLKEKEKEATKKTEIEEAKKKKEQEAAKKTKEQLLREEMERARKEEIRRLEKERLDKIRQRKFPMDDLMLIESDKELKVPNPPEGVQPRPKHLPLAFNYNNAARKSSGNNDNNALDFDKHWSTDHFRPVGVNLTSTSVEHLLQSYHVLFGDLGLCKFWTKYRPQDSKDIIIHCPPTVTVLQMACAVAEFDSGNAFRSKCVPPLICHTFTMILQLLLDIQDSPSSMEEDHEDGEEEIVNDNEKDTNSAIQSRRDDFVQLANALTPASCFEILKQYLQIMQRTSSHLYSKGEQQLSDDYYIENDENDNQNDNDGDGKTEEAVEENETGMDITADEHEPDEHEQESSEDIEEDVYVSSGALEQVFDKVCYGSSDCEGEGLDFWCLSSGEVFRLLRTLCEDLLVRKSEIIDAELQSRSDAIVELFETRRLANREYREARLAFEGPKSKRKASTKKSTKDGDENNKTNDTNDDDAGDDAIKTGDATEKQQREEKEEEPEEQKHVPTISKNAFESAKSAMEKANDAFERGVRSLSIRYSPLGYDRYYNAIYHFHSDPSLVYIKSDPQEKAVLSNGSYKPTSKQEQGLKWYCIDCKSLYDSFRSSLDSRGEREGSLLEALKSPNITIRRHLHDDIREKSERKAAKKKLEELESKLQVAMANASASNDEGGKQKRSSGRLAILAKEELLNVQKQIENEVGIWEEKLGPISPPDPLDLCGTTAMCTVEFERLKASLERASSDASNRRPPKNLKTGSGAFPKHYPGLHGSEHLSTSLCRPGGIIELLSAETKEMLNLLSAPYLSSEVADASRQQECKEKLEEAVQKWKLLCEPSSTADDDQSASTSSTAPLCRMTLKERRASKKQVFDTLDILRKELLGLEESLYKLSGENFVVDCWAKIDDYEEGHESETGDNNNGAEETTGLATVMNRRMAWKRIINCLYQIETVGQSTRVRDAVMLAIAATKNTNQSEILRELRSALQLYYDVNAKACRTAALELLGQYGGCSGETEKIQGEENEDSEAGGETSDPLEKQLNSLQDDNNQEENVVQSLNFSILSDEGAAINACIDGIDNCERQDWISAVKARDLSVSRFAALAQALFHQATEILYHLEEGNENFERCLRVWEKRNEEAGLKTSSVTNTSRRTGRRGSKTKKTKKQDDEGDNVDFVWTRCTRHMDQIVWVKLSDDWPWCPAFICTPDDPNVAKALADEFQRMIVCLVGDKEFHAIPKDASHLREPYNPKNCPDNNHDDKEAKSQKSDDNDDNEFESTVEDTVRKSKSMASRLYRCLFPDTEEPLHGDEEDKKEG